MTKLRIGTRGSPLALRQARAVESAIADTGGPACEIVTLTTTGDRLAQSVLAELGGKTVFVKEIDEALISGTVDLAVHSAKDLPSELPPGLRVCAALPREDPRDVLIVKAPTSAADRRPVDAGSLVASLGHHPTIATGSVRRVAQLRRHFPHATFSTIRGNVDTRIRKLDAGECDALVLAAAGVRRLGLGDRIAAHLSFEECVPAPGQGIVVIEARANDHATQDVVSAISDVWAMTSLAAERALLAELGGDCHVPIGAISTSDGTTLTLTALVATLDGLRAIQQRQQDDHARAMELGHAVGQALLRDGAAEIIADARAVQPS